MEARNIKTDTIELKKLMVEKGFETINSLSTASGVSRNTLGKVLNGKIQPSADVMYKLVETLEIPAPKAGTIFFAYILRTA